MEFDAGEVLIDGKSIEKQSVEAKRKMAFLPDNPDIYEFMTGIAYLNFIADIYGLSKAQREERIGSMGRPSSLPVPWAAGLAATATA